ncbi:MAG TPA: hypothetical protein DD434_00160 [Bacteroidales bacterium]|nr:hypothetical protein [Bacteroidales bacterium]
MKNRKKKIIVSFFIELNLIFSLGLIFYYLLQLILNVDFIYVFLAVAILYYLFSYFILKKTIFKYLNDKVSQRLKILLILFGANIIFYLLVMTLNNTHSSKYSFMGMRYYPYKVHLKVDKNVQNKIDFIKNENTSAKDYIINLFDKYDVVILGERPHTENTQWDLIYYIVSDRRFIEMSGNVFTEMGSTDYQYLADEYFKTKYNSEKELDKATTKLFYLAQGYTEKKNYFTFFKRLNLLNQTLPDSLKIRENFTGINLFPPDIKTPEEFEKHNKYWNRNYDSIMADNVIKGYARIQKGEKRKKMLVITNFTHSFNLTKHKFKNLKNETTYIFDSLKGSVANVLINSIAGGKKYYSQFFLGSHNKSSWDKAFELCGNKSIGFDLEGSPFGEDQFDMNLNFSQFKYKDIYHGFIFYKSKFDWVNWTGQFPYELEDDFIDEYKRRNILYGREKANLYIQEQRKSKDYDKFVERKMNTDLFVYAKQNIKLISYQLIFILSNFLILILILRYIIKSRK